MIFLAIADFFFAGVFGYTYSLNIYSKAHKINLPNCVLACIAIKNCSNKLGEKLRNYAKIVDNVESAALKWFLSQKRIILHCNGWFMDSKLFASYYCKFIMNYYKWFSKDVVLEWQIHFKALIWSFGFRVILFCVFCWDFWTWLGATLCFSRILYGRMLLKHMIQAKDIAHLPSPVVICCSIKPTVSELYSNWISSSAYRIHSLSTQSICVKVSSIRFLLTARCQLKSLSDPHPESPFQASNKLFHWNRPYYVIQA